MGTDIAKAALASGYQVVATGRNTEKVTKAIGASEDLLALKLEVTDPADAESAVKAADECKARAVQNRKYELVTSFGVRRTKSTGTARPRPPRCHTSLYRKP